MFWRFSYSNQLRAVFEWLSGIIREADIILVRKGGRDRFYRFKFPLRLGDMPHCEKAKRKEATFIVHIRTVESPPSNNQEWLKIFSSPEIEVYENKQHILRAAPLRWGLADENKKVALKIARDALERFLSDGSRLGSEYHSLLPQCFFSKTDLDVAVWVKGRLRGSAVIENYQLGQGIAQAAHRVARDARFKPLEIEELPDTRIEITLIRSPYLPLSDNKLERNTIYPDKGYMLLARGRKEERETRTAWFPPAVHNVRRYRNPDDFLTDLRQGKAMLEREVWLKAETFIFEVDDFIESKNHKTALSLWGPVIRQNFEFRISNLEFRLRMAADWLCRIQEQDGNFPPIINPLTGHQSQVDWTRLALTAWGLAEFGRSILEERYLHAARASLEYLKRFLLPAPQQFIPYPELTLAYFGELALSLGKHKEALIAGEILGKRILELPFSPITFSQIASFFVELAKIHRQFRGSAISLAAITRECFEKSEGAGESLRLVEWAGLIHTYMRLTELTRDASHQKFIDHLAGWLKRNQLPSGAFSESIHSVAELNLTWGYTRGTGKIVEALALDPERNREALERALSWLFSMQYNEENSFFVPEAIRPKIIGAFRHDYFNPDAWIDAAGHIFLGGAMLINKNLWK